MGVVERLGGRTSLLKRWRRGDGSLRDEAMRLIACIALMLALTAPALGQTPDAAPSGWFTEAPPAEDLPAERLQRARIVASAFMDLMTPDLIDEQVRTQAPPLQHQMLSGPFYEGLRPDTQRSLQGFVETAPELVRDEVWERLNATGDDFARRLAARYSTEELADIAAVYTDPTMRAMVTEMVRTYVAGGTYDRESLSIDQRAAIDALGETPAARTAVRNSWEINRHLAQSASVVSRLRTPAFRRRFMQGICDALGDECTDRIRAMIPEE